MNLILLIALMSASVWAEEPQKIPIPKVFTDCKSDAECGYTSQFCGCCDYVAMNKRFIKKYVALEKYCKEPPPPCKCAPANFTPKCVKKVCQLIPNN